MELRSKFMDNHFFSMDSSSQSSSPHRRGLERRGARPPTFYNSPNPPYSPPEACWSWQSDFGYVLYDVSVCDFLENAFIRGEQDVTFRIGRWTYTVDLTEMRQTNVSTHRERNVRRSTEPCPVWLMDVSSSSLQNARLAEAATTNSLYPISAASGSCLIPRFPTPGTMLPSFFSTDDVLSGRFSISPFHLQRFGVTVEPHLELSYSTADLPQQVLWEDHRRLSHTADLIRMCDTIEGQTTKSRIFRMTVTPRSNEMGGSADQLQSTSAMSDYCEPSRTATQRGSSSSVRCHASSGTNTPDRPVDSQPLCRATTGTLRSRADVLSGMPFWLSSAASSTAPPIAANNSASSIMEPSVERPTLTRQISHSAMSSPVSWPLPPSTASQILYSRSLIGQKIERCHGNCDVVDMDVAESTMEDHEPVVDGDCAICLDELSKDVVKLKKCCHIYHKDCILEYISKGARSGFTCPTCNVLQCHGNGPSPAGTMIIRIFSDSWLDGYPSTPTITIVYEIKGGVQSRRHPNPGQPFSGTSRTAYLPYNKEGRLALEVLRRAFVKGQTFTVGTSITSGASNVAVWNGIHHKTSVRGGSTRFGYPDDTYLQRLMDELKMKGLEPTSEEIEMVDLLFSPNKERAAASRGRMFELQPVGCAGDVMTVQSGDSDTSEEEECDECDRDVSNEQSEEENRNDRDTMEVGNDGQASGDGDQDGRDSGEVLMCGDSGDRDDGHDGSAATRDEACERDRVATDLNFCAEWVDESSSSSCSATDPAASESCGHLTSPTDQEIPSSVSSSSQPITSSSARSNFSHEATDTSLIATQLPAECRSRSSASSSVTSPASTLPMCSTTFSTRSPPVQPTSCGPEIPDPATKIVD